MTRLSQGSLGLWAYCDGLFSSCDDRKYGREQQAETESGEHAADEGKTGFR